MSFMALVIILVLLTLSGTAVGFVAGYKWRDRSIKAGTPSAFADKRKPSASQISAAANEWAEGNPNAFGINGFRAGVEWMRQKLHQ
jgi:hypothetical protein